MDYHSLLSDTLKVDTSEHSLFMNNTKELGVSDLIDASGQIEYSMKGTVAKPEAETLLERRIRQHALSVATFLQPVFVYHFCYSH